MYEHGGNLFEFSERYNIKKSRILDFSSNVNPLGPSKKVIYTLKKHIDEIALYPDPRYKRLRKALANYYKVTIENVLVGNGATEIIHILPLAFKFRKALLFAPSFFEYEASLKKVCENITYIHLDLKNFQFDYRSVSERIGMVDVIFICNPNNPSSTLFKKEYLLSLIAQANKKGVMIIVDESFMDFLDEPEAHSLLPYIYKFTNLIILRSLTKILALPGLRIGSVIANSDVIRQLSYFLWPWNVNVLAEYATIIGIEDLEYIKKMRRCIYNAKKILWRKLNEIPGLEIVRPEANFILFKVIQDIDLRERLMQYGILIRDCRNFQGLGPGYYRISVRREKHNRKLIKYLRRVLMDV